MTGRLVWHEPVWVPGPLRIDEQGNVAPGFLCIHPLENGMGLCNSNVFEIRDAHGKHACHVPEEVS